MKREPAEIKALILQLCESPKTKTEIYVGLKAPATFYRKYIQQLETANLLQKEGKKYRTTEKGKRWLTAYQQLKTLEQPAALPEASNWSRQT